MKGNEWWWNYQKLRVFYNFKILTFSTIIWNNIRKFFEENAGWGRVEFQFQFQKFPTQES